MNVHRLLVLGTAALVPIAIDPEFAAATLNVAPAPVQMVITALPAHGKSPVEPLTPSALAVLQGDTRTQVTSVEPLTGDRSDMQMVILLDDSTRSASLTLHFSALRSFLKGLPPTAEVAVGYMRNGMGPLVQPFTLNHEAAANSLHVPLSVPGSNGSPYFALSELVQHWPSKKPAPRRVVLMLTDGVDRYFDNSMIDDPYVDAAILDAAKQGVAVYAIYLRGAGGGGQGAWTMDFAQSRLSIMAEQTGGYAYFEDFTDPVTIAPFLGDLQARLSNQYRITVAGLHGRGLQAVKVRSELPGVKITAPERVYLP